MFTLEIELVLLIGALYFYNRDVRVTCKSNYSTL